MTAGLAANLLQLIASLLEFIGAIMMANVFFSSLPIWQWTDLIKSIFSKRAAEATARHISDFGQEQKTYSVRGVAFIVLGFFIQIIGVLLNLAR